MVPALFLFASLVNDVRGLMVQHDFAGAERAVRTYQAQAGATSELAAALSWLARGALDARRFDQAEAYAAETRKLALELLRTHKLDGDRWLPTALGASIEVHAQALAAHGERPEAIAFLRQQLDLFGATSLNERIRKNMNLLTLQGNPAPVLRSLGRYAGTPQRRQFPDLWRQHHSHADPHRPGWGGPFLPPWGGFGS